MDSFFNNTYSLLIKNTKLKTNQEITTTDMAVEHHGRNVPITKMAVEHHGRNVPITKMAVEHHGKHIPLTRMAVKHHGISDVPINIRTHMAVEHHGKYVPITLMAVEHHGYPRQPKTAAESSEPEPFCSNDGLSWSSIIEYPKQNNEKTIPRQRPANVATFMAAEHHGAKAPDSNIMDKCKLAENGVKNHGIIVDYENLKIDSPLNLDEGYLSRSKQKSI